MTTTDYTLNSLDKAIWRNTFSYWDDRQKLCNTCRATCRAFDGFHLFLSIRNMFVTGSPTFSPVICSRNSGSHSNDLVLVQWPKMEKESVAFKFFPSSLEKQKFIVALDPYHFERKRKICSFWKDYFFRWKEMLLFNTAATFFPPYEFLQSFTVFWP